MTSLVLLARILRFRALFLGMESLRASDAKGPEDRRLWHSMQLHRGAGSEDYPVY